MARLSRLYNKRKLEDTVKQSKTFKQVLEAFNLYASSSNRIRLKAILEEYDISTDHFAPYGKTGPRGMSVPDEEYFTNPCPLTNRSLRARLNKIYEEERKPWGCETPNCWSKWTPKPDIWNRDKLPLEIHHANGDRTDNRRENLIRICPNCHAQEEIKR